MNEQWLALMQRRGALIASIDMQRGELARIEKDFRGPLAFADKGVALFRYLRGHPWMAAGMATVIVARRRGVIGLLKAVWRLRTGYRLIKAMARKLTRAR
ncbi:MAG: YqjK family protein [Gallionella sp.]